MDTSSNYQRRINKWKKVKKLPPPKTTIAAVLMLVTGTIFLVLGASITWGRFHSKLERDRGIAMLVIGFMTFLPGSYASFNLYGAYYGWPGYSYTSIPSYDD